MPLGNLQTEADLRRFIEVELQRPGVLRLPPSPAISKIKNGAPSDADFPNPPANGTLALDASTGTLYARVNNAWEAL